MFNHEGLTKDCKDDVVMSPFFNKYEALELKKHRLIEKLVATNERQCMTPFW